MSKSSQQAYHPHSEGRVGALLQFSRAHQPSEIYEVAKWEDVLVKRLGFLSYLSSHPEEVEKQFKNENQSVLDLKIQTNVQIATAYSNLGLDYLAYLYYEKAIKLRPGNFRAIGGLSEMLGRLGKVERAETFLLEAIVQSPENEFLYKKLGDLYYVSGRYQLAVLPYQKAIELKPDWHIAPFLKLLVEVMYSSEQMAGVSRPESMELAAVKDTEWTGLLMKFLKQQSTEADIVDFIKQSEAKDKVPLMSEALYYVGEHYHSKGDIATAQLYLNATVDMKVTYYIETAFARSILKRLGQFEKTND